MPTARYGRTGSYNQTVGVKLDIDDAINILTPVDVPLLSSIGTGSTNQIKVEWLNEELTPQEAVQTAAPTGTGPWTVTVGTTNVNWFRPNDILWTKDAASSVQYTVTSIDTAAGTMVIAGFAGNTTAPANGETLVIVGQYRVEGGDPEEQRSTERGTQFNYTEIFQERVEATRTARKRELYGQGDPYDHEVEKKFKELRIRWERAALYGQRAISSDNKQRSLGGVFYYNTTNSESGLKANTKSLLNALIRKLYDAGADPSLVLMVSPSVKVAISENVDASLRRVDRDDTTGGYVVERYLSDLGEFRISTNRFLPRTKGLALTLDNIERVAFTPAFHELLAKTGDSDRGEIVEESTLKFKNPEAHGVLTLTDA